MSFIDLPSWRSWQSVSFADGKVQVQSLPKYYCFSINVLFLKKIDLFEKTKNWIEIEKSKKIEPKNAKKFLGRSLGSVFQFDVENKSSELVYFPPVNQEQK